MKKIIIIGAIILIFLGIVFYHNHTVNLSGVIVVNGIENEANITVSYKQINKILNRMSGNVCIQTKDSENILEYKFSGPIFTGGDCDFTTIYRFYTKQRENPFENGYESQHESKYEYGYMFFDKELKNIVINTSEHQFYAADAEFIDIVRNTSSSPI